MRKFLFIVGLWCISNALFAQKSTKSQLEFPLAEHIRFKVNYGWFSLGEASMTIGDSLVIRGGEQYYHNSIEAKTVGMFSWLAGVQNTYWGLVNTKNYKTIYAETHLDERKGKYDQWNTFDYQKMKTHVKMVNHTKGTKKELDVKLTDKAYDLHGTYMFLRSELWRGYHVSDSIMLSTYWEDKLYDFGMEYGGMEKIKFNGEKVTTHKFYGLFPVSTTFPKEKGVVVWIMEREGMGIPILIEAELKIGKVRCELKDYMVDGVKVLSVED